MRLLDDGDEEDLHAVAERYHRAAPAYQRDLQRTRPTRPHFAVPDAPARAGPSSKALPVPQLLQSYDHDVRRADETAKTSDLASLVRARRPPVVDPMPVGAWIRFTTAPNKGVVALLVSPTRVLIARGADSVGCRELEFPRAVDSSQAQRDSPTTEELAPFHLTRHPALSAPPFVGACTALGEGDRVVVIHGAHRGDTGYIIMLRDVPVQHPESGHRGLARWAKIQPQYDGTSDIKKGGPGNFFDLRSLKRHLLDHPLPLQLLDRVQVVSGLVHRELTGRVIEINRDEVKVEIPTPSNETLGLENGRLPDTKCFNVNLRYLRRKFECGDLVEVVRGLYKTRMGMIVASYTGGGLELFDVSLIDIMCPSRRPTV